MSAAAVAHERIAPSDRLFAYDPRVIGLVARIAETIARPIGRTDASLCDIEPLDAESILRAAEALTLARPLNELVADKAGLRALDVSPDFVSRLSARPTSRLSALIAAASTEALHDAAVLLSAAALHPRILLMPHKAQRLALVEAFGEDAYRLATREAPLQYRRLGELAQRLEPDFIVAEAPILAERILEFGQTITLAFLDACERELAALARMRWPALARIPAPAFEIAGAHCELIVKLCSRRFPEWSAIIA